MADTTPLNTARPQITTEQLEFFAELEAEAIQRAEARFERRERRSRRQFLVGYLILLVALVVVYTNSTHISNASRESIVQSGKVVAVDGCNGRYDSTDKLRAIFVRLDQANLQQYKSGKIPKDQRRAAHKFYAEQIRLTPLPDCRKAEALLTDNPDAKIKHITPKYPKQAG